ncbi:MAG TPA: uroporphyrinogen decarboxylase family protein [Ignavibacteria bacterium]
MNSRERIIKTMNFEEPDRVPLMCQFSIGFMLKQLKISPAEFWFDHKTFIDGLIELRSIFKFDGILVSLHGHNLNWRKNVLRIAKESKGERVFWSNGDETFCPDNDLPYHIPKEKNQKLNIEDINPDKLPEEIDYIPVSQGLYFHLDKDNLLSIFNEIFDKTEQQYSIHGEITSPLDYFMDLLGHESSLLALIDEPEKCKDILQKYTDGIKNLALKMCEQNIDAIKISSPYAGAGFLSRSFYKEFVLPYETQIAKAIREKGKHVYIHTCGSIGDRLELIAESDTSGLECLDPPPIGDCDLEDAKKRLGKRCFIKGNIDSVNTLLKKSIQEVKEDARKRIEIGKPGGGFILSTACSIAPDVPRENILALYDTVEEYGWY